MLQASSWSFGQILPVVLLVAPLWSTGKSILASEQEAENEPPLRQSGTAQAVSPRPSQDQVVSDTDLDDHDAQASPGIPLMSNGRPRPPRRAQRIRPVVLSSSTLVDSPKKFVNSNLSIQMTGLIAVQIIPIMFAYVYEVVTTSPQPGTNIVYFSLQYPGVIIFAIPLMSVLFTFMWTALYDTLSKKSGRLQYFGYLVILIWAAISTYITLFLAENLKQCPAEWSAWRIVCQNLFLLPSAAIMFAIGFGVTFMVRIIYLCYHGERSRHPRPRQAAA